MTKWASKQQIQQLSELYPHESNVTIMGKTHLTIGQLRYFVKKLGLKKSDIRLKKAHRPQALRTNFLRWGYPYTEEKDTITHDNNEQDGKDL